MAIIDDDKNKLNQYNKNIKKLNEEIADVALALSLEELIESETKLIKNIESLRLDTTRNHSKHIEELEVELSRLTVKLNESMEINDRLGDTIDLDELLLDKEADLRVETEKREDILKRINEEKLKELTIVEKLNGLNTVGNNIQNAAKNIINEIYGTWIDIDNASAEYQRTIGGSSEMLRDMRKTTNQIVLDFDYAAKMGLTSSELIKLQLKFSETIGRNISLSGQHMGNLGAMAKLVGDTSAIALTDTLDIIGLNIDEADNLITKIYNDSVNKGIAFNKVSKEFTDNLKMAQTYTFKDGLEGMRRMTMEASRLRLTMRDVTGVADKLSNVEDAINLSANLQVLGGPFAQFAQDPMRLMYLSLNDPEKLMEMLTKTASSMTTFDPNEGRFKIDVVQQQMMKRASSVLGLDATDFSNTGTNLAKYNAVERQLNGSLDNNTQLKEYFINTSTWDKISKSWVINHNGNTITQQALLDNTDLLNTIADKINVDYKNSINIVGDNMSMQETANAAIKALNETKARNAEFITNDKLIKDLIKTGASSNILLSGISTTSTAILVAVQAMAVGQSLRMGSRIMSSPTRNLNRPSGGVMSGLNKPNVARGLVKGTAIAGVAGVGTELYKNHLLNTGKIEEGGNADKWMSGISGGLMGAGLGAQIGTLIMPGVGTAIGAGIGAIGGLLFSQYQINNKQQTEQEATRYRTNTQNYYQDNSTTYRQMANGGLLIGNSHSDGGIKGTGRFNNIETQGGEYVVKKEVTTKHLNTLEKMNNDSNFIVPTTQPLGKIMKVEKHFVTNNNNNINQTIDLEPIDLNINGTIKLESNGKTINLDKDVLNNPVFIKKLTSLISKQLNVNKYGIYNKNASNQKSI